MQPVDILKDNENFLLTPDGQPLRKGTVAAFIENCRILKKTPCTSPDFGKALTHAKELYPSLVALNLFEVFSLDASLQKYFSVDFDLQDRGIFHDNPEVVFIVGAVIENQKKEILILKRAANESFLPNVWEIPSGHVDSGENLLQGLERELKEETNLDLWHVLEEVAHFDYLSASGTKKLQKNYRILVKDFDVLKLNPKEHSQFQWVSPNEMSDISPMSEKTRLVLKSLC